MTQVSSTEGFTDEQLLRFNRHILLANVDIQGQQTLADSTVLIIGLGGLGCPAAQYLCSAGVGHLVLCDGDIVSLSNLQRQVLFSEAQLGLPKTRAAAVRLQALNSNTKLTEVNHFADANELPALVSQATLVLDCSDNITTRYDINFACKRAGVPLVSAAAIGWSGQHISFDFRNQTSPCYRCVLPELNEQALNCNDSGIMGPVVGQMGVTQALEALKILLSLSDQQCQLHCFDGLSGQWLSFKVNKQENCPCCGELEP